MGFQLPISSCMVEKRKANMSSIGRSTGDDTKKLFEKRIISHFKTAPISKRTPTSLQNIIQKDSARDFHPCRCQVLTLTS